MSGAKKTFLLPCVGCACDIDVVAGQAGGQVACPSCGRSNDVPKFRDLSQLKVKAQETGVRSRRWGLPQAVALAGAACAALAWATAAVVGATPTSVLDLAKMRASIEAADDAALYRSLQIYAQSSVDRGALREEVGLRRRALFAQRMSGAMYVIGGAGAVAAAVAGLSMLAGGRRT